LTVERRVAVADDGTRLAVRAHPGDISQVPFLLVHGLSSNARLWDQVGDGLSAAGFPSYAVDQRGHGESERPDRGYDHDTASSDLFAVLRDVVGRRAILVGQSWGGNVVLETASRHPRLASAVVCVDGGFIRLRDRHSDWETVWPELAPPVFDHLSHADLDREMRQWLDGWTEAGIAAQLGNFDLLADGSVRPRLPREHHRAILRAMWEHDPDPVAAALEVPVWVVAVGEDDPEKASRVETFAAGLRRGRVIWIDGHHDVHAEQPEKVVDALVDLALEIGP
jgi:pimeloyl-ACP methyl ester carboxylesterase